MLHIRVLWLLCAVMSTVLATQQMPRFEFSKSSKIMLTWDDLWEVGCSNMLAILSDSKKIRIRVRITGDTGSGMKRLLKYTCPKSSVSDTIDLNSLAAGAAEPDRCADTIAFKIAALGPSGGEDFSLTMGSSKLGYQEVFKQRVEMNIVVEYSTGTLTSNKLFVWSLDAISGFNSASSGSYTPRFLTDGAVAFMKKISVTGVTAEFSSIPFLNSEISRVLKEAPDFFKAKMNLGSILYFDAGSCQNVQVGNSVMFVNYNSKFENENQKFQKVMRLNIDDGNLWYSTCGLRQEVKQFFDKKRPPTVSICTIVSFSGDVEPYQRTDAVQQRVPLSETSYATCSPATKSCFVVGASSQSVTILSGMDYTAIVCPIICNDKTEVFRFYHDDRQLIGKPGDGWTFVEGVRISETGNIVEFPPTLSSSHSGKYRCEAGSKTFTFDVKVISLPQFQTDVYTSGSKVGASGMPPPKVYAIEGEYLSYSCAVYFASLDTVKVDPVFYFVSTTGGKVTWEKLSLEAFRLKVGADSKSFYLNETAEGTDSKRLTVNVVRVPPVHQSFGTNFTHRFVCDSSISATESMKVGMPAYGVQSGGDVVFVPRLTRNNFILNPNNNCSIQNCAFGRGAFFEFSLTDEFMDFLNGIGVEVVSFLKLDDDLLSDIKILFNNATEIFTDGNPKRLAYKIYPVSDKNVAMELVNRKVLTPVYNFRYKEGSDLGNLKLDKDSHGVASPGLGSLDCRIDPLCFYSTDFDVTSSLDFLPVILTFSMPNDPAPVAAASALWIGIAVGVLCLIIIIVLIVYFLKREPEQAYFVEEKEIQMGHNPKEEAKQEVFKEYQRVANQGGEDGEGAPLQGNRVSLGSVSIGSGDDKELDQYKDDMDYKEFGEQGSFIGGYQNDPRKKEAFNAANQGNEETV